MLGLRIGSRIHDDDMRDICAYAVVCGLREHSFPEEVWQAETTQKEKYV